MSAKIINYFSYSAAILLLATASAKLISSAGGAKFLNANDPILSLSFRNVFWLVGLLELAVALTCLMGRALPLKVTLIAWLASSFGLYRLGLLALHYHRPCS